MLKIENLSFAYKGQSTPYVHNLTLDLAEIALISGPSGSGKSTLLDLIAGFLIPTTGTILLDNLNLVPLAPEERPVSILFQADNLFDHLSVRKNLSLGLPPKAANKTQAIEDALAEVGLAQFISRRASDLSGGQKQRVALARTLLRDKLILLLDEPFASLDPLSAQKMRDLIRRLTTRHGWHTLIVSHLPEDAKSFVDKSYKLEL